MPATLQSYITEVRYLLHDANSNFYTNDQLIGYINDARQRVVRDTGCLRQIQTTQTPCTPVAGGAAPYSWSSGYAAATDDYVFDNIFLYRVTVGGTLGDAPGYPDGDSAYPPSAPFASGTATVQYAGNCEIINYAALPQGLLTLDVLNVNLYWGNSRIPLRYLAWTQFNAQLRYWQNYIGTPVAFSTYGQGQLYLGPVPDKVYAVDLDTVILPTEMEELDDVDTIVDPYTTVVKFYAAHTAKYYEQSFGEAELYLQQYKQKTQAVLTSTYTRRIPDAYNNPY
jgi:hypothetical protein